MNINNLVLLLIAASIIHIHASETTLLSSISDLLGLGSKELILEEVTKRESEVRGIDFTDVQIVSVKGGELIYPIIIYKAPVGELNSGIYLKLREEMRNPTSHESSASANDKGFLFEGEDEAYFFADSLKIASNSPPVKGVYTPWEARRFMGYSIIGTLKSKKTDFQVFIIEPSKEVAGQYPTYRDLFLKPPDLRKLGGEIYAVINDAGLLDLKVTAGERPPKSRGDDGRNDRTGGSDVRSDKRDDKHPARSENGGDGTPASSNLWLWIICAAVIVLSFLFLIILKVRR